MRAARHEGAKMLTCRACGCPAGLFMAQQTGGLGLGSCAMVHTLVLLVPHVHCNAHIMHVFIYAFCRT